MKKDRKEQALLHLDIVLSYTALQCFGRVSPSLCQCQTSSPDCQTQTQIIPVYQLFFFHFFFLSQSASLWFSFFSSGFSYMIHMCIHIIEFLSPIKSNGSLVFEICHLCLYDIVCMCAHVHISTVLLLGCVIAEILLNIFIGCINGRLVHLSVHRKWKRLTFF